MKNLEENLKALLRMKEKKQQFVLETEQGLSAMANNQKGVVKNVDQSILQMLFGEAELSEENSKLFNQLKRVKVGIKPAKKEKESKKV